MSSIFQSETTSEISKALCGAQAAIKNPGASRAVDIQSKSGGKFGYKYTELKEIIALSKEVLKDHGLSIVQLPNLVDTRFVLVTTIFHTSGEWIRSLFPIDDSLDDRGIGSSITYARRYTQNGILNIATDLDDDGEAAVMHKAKTKAALKPSVIPPGVTRGTPEADKAIKSLAPYTGDPGEYIALSGAMKGKTVREIGPQYFEDLQAWVVKNNRKLDGPLAQLAEQGAIYKQEMRALQNETESQDTHNGYDDLPF